MGYKKIKEKAIRKGRFPVKVTLEYWDETPEKPFIDLYSGNPTKKGYTHNHFKITNKLLWQKIKKIIDEDYIFKLKNVVVSEKAIEKQEIEEIEFLKKDNLRLKKRLQSISQLVLEYHKLNVLNYKKDLEQLKKLLSTAKKEVELQDFLTEKTWLLGLEYEIAKPQKINSNYRYDFYVQKYDGFADIIELKKADASLFDKNGKLSSELGKGIQQIISYIDEAILDGDSKRLTKKYNLNFLKPKGILIIGRNKKEDFEKLRNLSFYFHNIEILTYDDIYERGKRILENINKIKKR